MEDAISWFKMTGFSRWALSFNESSAKQFACSSQGATHATATEELRKALGFFPERKNFQIDASPGTGEADAKKHLYFTGSKEQTGVSGPYGQAHWPPMPPQQQGMSKEEVATMVKDAVDRARLEDRLASLTAELALLKGQSPQTATDAAIAAVAGTFNQYLPFILFDGKPPMVAPVSGPKVVRDPDEATRIAADAMARLQKVCDDHGIELVDMLAKMANKAQADPSQLVMLNQMLG